MNILSNAIDALRERERKLIKDQKSKIKNQKNDPPQIRIVTEQNDEDWVTIRIADNGHGMPEAVRQRIFDPFFTTKPVGKGTGLGLSISYQIVVENHSGQFQCISNPGQGTEFIIKIPLQHPKS